MASLVRTLFLLLSIPLAADVAVPTPSGTISGSVFALTGTRLPGVLITLTHKETGAVFQVTTSDRGLYQATGLPPGRFEVVAELSGFKPCKVPEVFLAEAGSRGLDMVLSVDLTVNEVVTVIGEAPTDSLEAAALRESPARDVGEALAELAGLWKVRKGGIANDVVLRGFQRGDLNVLIDGQRLYGACPNRMDPASFHVDFAEVDHIEVGKGPFDMKNQGSLGGAINVVTRKPQEGWHASANLSAGSYAFLNPSATVSYGGPVLFVLGGYSYRSSSPYRDGSGRRFTELSNYEPAAEKENAFEIGTAWSKMGWTPAPQHHIQFSYTRQDVNRTYYPYLWMDAVYDDTDRLSFRYDGEALSDSLTGLSAQAYFNRVHHWMTDEHRTSSSSTPRGYSMGTLADTRTWGGKLEAQILGLTLGAEAFDRFWGATTEMAGMLYHPQFSLPDVTLRNLGFYGEYDKTIAEGLRLGLGARIDRTRSAADSEKAAIPLYLAYHGTDSTSATDTFVSGKVRLTYTSGEWEIGAGIGHTVRTPEPSERYFGLRRMGSDWVGNPGLFPSRNTGADLTLAHERSGLYVGGNLHVNRVNDYISVYNQPRINEVPGVMGSQARSYANVDATLWGGELDVVSSLTDRLFLSSDIAYVRGTKTTRPELGIESRNLAEVPPLHGRLQLRFDTGRYYGSVEGVFSARQTKADTDLQEEETPGYAVAHLRFGMRRERLSLTLGIDNLLNESYIEHLSYQRDPLYILAVPRLARECQFDPS